MSTITAITVDLGVALGKEATTKTGIKGRVTSIAIALDGRCGAWIEGIDSTGRPFETYVRAEDFAPEAT